MSRITQRIARPIVIISPHSRNPFPNVHSCYATGNGKGGEVRWAWRKIRSTLLRLDSGCQQSNLPDPHLQYGLVPEKEETALNGHIPPFASETARPDRTRRQLQELAVRREPIAHLDMACATSLWVEDFAAMVLCVRRRINCGKPTSNGL